MTNEIENKCIQETLPLIFYLLIIDLIHANHLFLVFYNYFYAFIFLLSIFLLRSGVYHSLQFF